MTENTKTPADDFVGTAIASWTLPEDEFISEKE
jgi:hypothetical protein